MRAAVKNAAVLLAVLLFMAAVGLTVGCPIKRTVGLPCPGCGMTRACLSLLSLNLRAAFYWHPLCFLVVPLGVMFVLKDTATGRRFLNCAPLMAALAAVVILVYLARMALMFPDTPPMQVQENSLVVKIVHKFLLQ